MDELLELKKKARSLELKGDERGALDVYTSIEGAQADPGVLVRRGALEARLGDTEGAVDSHVEAAAMLLESELPHAAIAVYRRLARLVPDRPSTQLRIAELSARAGFLSDAAGAYGEFLRGEAGSSAVDELLASLDALPAAARAQLAARLRDDLLETHPGEANRLDALAEETADADAGSDLEIIPPYLPSGGTDPDLLPTAFAAGDDAPESVAPVEGLETLGAEALTGAPSIPPEVETSREAVGVDDWEEVQEESADDELPLLGYGPVHGEGGADEVGADEGGADEGGAGEPEVAAREDVHDWVDLGALVMSDEEELGGGGGTREARARDSERDEEDFGPLLEELGAGSASRTTADVGSAYDLGLAYKEMGLLDEAIAQLQTALVGSGNPLPTLEVLGECYLESGDAERACSVLQRATALEGARETELVGVRYLLGRCEEELGRREEARDAYQRVVALEPEFRDAADRLERL